MICRDTATGYESSRRRQLLAGGHTQAMTENSPFHQYGRNLRFAVEDAEATADAMKAIVEA